MTPPTESEWKEIAFDIPAIFAFHEFYGKTHDEAIEAIYKNPVERAFDLGHMAKKPFQYYMLAYQDYVLANKFKPDNEKASYACFFAIFCSIAEHKPDYLQPILSKVIKLVTYIANNQQALNLTDEAFGDFSGLLNIALGNLKK
ncbi:hypothetical protein [Zooshikella sp. RANM57]|uniref:hypothetical protein n=1 Tax=Zooshikella sp. RANM57 TaxID=3425863 RepID=UPI003D6F82CC